MKNIEQKVLINYLSWALLLVSAYFFSRFTVDDAFISWRYGANLIQTGFFNYNPSDFDLTQSYTNPLFAILSIIPAAINLDVVLFFKIVSLLTIGFFLYFLYAKYKIHSGALVFIAIPASIIHAFSGLETFLFISLLVVLYDNLKNNNVRYAIVTVSVLFLVRPESYLLAVLVPIYFMSEKNSGLNPIKKISSIFRKKKNENYLSLILPLILFIILFAHKMYFGNYLPNTFYIKSVNNDIHLLSSLLIVCQLLPALLSILLISKNKNTSLFYVFFFLFLAMSINYSISDLQMNYAQRFLFHIYAPLFFILLIEAKSQQDLIKIEYHKKQINISIFNAAAMFVFMFLTLLQTNLKELLILADYYPRAQISHAALGYAIKDSGANAMSIGDAGMAPFNAQINSLDIIGLGSGLVARNGVNKKTIDTYNPDIVVFYARPAMGIRIGDHNTKPLFKWVQLNNLTSICEVIFREDYSLLVYGKQYINSDSINKVCKASHYNLNKSSATFAKYVLSPPWKYWNNKR